MCLNYLEHNVCNWATDESNAYCLSCRLTRVIPDLAAPENKEAWYKVEVAKRRLVYSLLTLKLPLQNKVDDPKTGLAFHFLADPPGEPTLPPVKPGTEFTTVLDRWHALTYLMNNLNRGMGLPDGYPFVLSTPVAEKLRLIHEVVTRPK